MFTRIVFKVAHHEDSNPARVNDDIEENTKGLLRVFMAGLRDLYKSRYRALATALGITGLGPGGAVGSRYAYIGNEKE